MYNNNERDLEAQNSAKITEPNQTINKLNKKLLCLILGAILFVGALCCLSGSEQLGLSSVERKLLVAQWKIEYITDIEGQWKAWESTVKSSKIIELRTDGKLYFKSPYLSDGFFVYGGDINDRGDGDVRIGEALVDFKQRHADRVRFIIGNRDLNKFRLTREILKEPDSFFDQSENFVAHSKGVKDGNFTTFRNSQKEGKKNCEVFEKWDGKSTVPPESNQICRLKFILSETMGAKKAFQYRIKELKGLGRDFTEAGVLKSYLDSMKDDGYMLTYLKNAYFIWLWEQNMFTHSIWLPTVYSHDNRKTLDYMFAQQENWFMYMKQYYDNPDSEFFDYGELHQMVYAPANAIYSHKYYNELTRKLIGGDNNERNDGPVHKEFLKIFREKPRVIDTYPPLFWFVGHTPNGDSPTAVYMGHVGSDSRRVYVINADIGRACARITKEDFYASDTRGGAVANFIIDTARKSVTITGKTTDEKDNCGKGTGMIPDLSYDIHLPDRSAVGTVILDGKQLVKFMTKDGKHYTAENQGYQIIYRSF